MIHCLRRGKKTAFLKKSLKAILNHAVDRIYLQQLEYEMRRVDLPEDYNYFEIGYCGHPAFPYAHIKLEQASKLILSHFQEEDHTYIYDTLGNKKKQLVFLYFENKSKKNASRTDITDDYQKSYTFVPTCGDGSTAFHRHMSLSLVLVTVTR